MSAFYAVVKLLSLILAVVTVSCSPTPPTLQAAATATLAAALPTLNQATLALPTVTFTATRLTRVTVQVASLSPATSTPMPPLKTATPIPAAPGPTATPSATTVPPTPDFEPTALTAVEPTWQVVALINRERTRRGLTALVIEPRLMAAAQAHSQDMAENDFFDHIGSDGSTPGDRITRAGYPWTFFAENLGCRYPTAEAVVQAWLESPGHRANMLAAQAEHIGVGLVHDPQADCEYYWGTLFAAGG